MATVGSSLSSACSVFGAPQALTNLYRGGSYVRNYASYSGVDSGGSGLALSQLNGLVYPVSAYASGVRDPSALGSWLGAAQITFNSDGSIDTNEVTGFFSSHVLYGSGSHFQWYVQLTSSQTGFTASGSFNTWTSSFWVRQPTTEFGGTRYASGYYYVRETLSDHQWAGGTWSLECGDNS